MIDFLQRSEYFCTSISDKLIGDCKQKRDSKLFEQNEIFLSQKEQIFVFDHVAFCNFFIPKWVREYCSNLFISFGRKSCVVFDEKKSEAI